MKRTALTVAFLVFLSAFVVIITVLLGARATTLYVGGGGPGNYTTIQSAIDSAIPGTTIFVFDGTYNENLVVDRTLSIVGESKDSTDINGGGFGDTIHVTADWVNLTGFFVWNGGLNGWDAGIELDHVQNCSISDNNFIVNDYNGIFLRSSHNNTIANNTVAFNVDLGIYLLSSHNNTIIDNNVSFNLFNIALDSSNGNVIANNNASNSDSGISLFYSDDNIVTGNNASNNTNRGIYLEYSDNTRIENNTASNNTNEGIHIQFSLDNNVLENRVSYNEAGIYLWYSDRHFIVNNTASHNVYGVFIDDSKFDTFAGNLLVENGFYLEGNPRDWNNHSIDTTNTVNGRPVQYWKNATGGTVPVDAGQVILANCTGVTVENQNISEATVGIAIGHSSGSTVINNALSSNGVAGILLDSSEDVTVNKNTAHGNTYGVSIFYRGGNHITGNTISLNWRGVLLRSSSQNIVDNNTVSENGGGFDLLWADGNVFYNNSIRLNSEFGASLVVSDDNLVVRNLIHSSGLGLYVPMSTGNLVYHNDFVDNPQSAYDDSTDNQWDDGYPSGGNYWSDYTGIDLSSGPNQDQPGSDGIGDTSYDQIGMNEDRYPLMSPLTTIMPRPPESLQAYLNGAGMENVTIEWDLSPDDGSGLGSVVGYEVYRGSAYSPGGSGYGLLASLTNGMSSFIDNRSGEGNPNNYFYRVCAVDLSNNSACAEDQAGKFTRPLASGPNLVSLPLIQSDESIERVLQTVRYDRAWFYDSSTEEWKWFMKHKGYRRGLWSVNHTMGLWVNVTSDCNFTMAGIVPDQTTIHLRSGWNLVSFPSFNSSYTVYDLKMDTGALRVEGYDPDPPYHLRVLGDAEVLQAGEGYWVRVLADTDWIVEAS